MTRSESRLLRILLWTSLACVTVLISFTQLERISAAVESEKDYQARIERLRLATVDEETARIRRAQLAALVEAAETNRKNEPLADFGHAVRAKLGRQGIEPSRYQVVSVSGKDQLDFSFRCGILPFMRFLREVRVDEGGWSIPYLSLKAGGTPGEADIVVRIADEH